MNKWFLISNHKDSELHKRELSDFAHIILNIDRPSRLVFAQLTIIQRDNRKRINNHLSFDILKCPLQEPAQKVENLQKQVEIATKMFFDLIQDEI